jgi:hypothetical protein
VALAYLLGLGWLAVGPLLHGSLTIKKRDLSLLQEIPLMMLSGLIINYGIILSFQTLLFAVIIGCIISLVGISCFTFFLIRFHTWHMLISPSLIIWVGISFICLIFLSPIVTEPLAAWDARSIWFFHAKMIYVAGSIGFSAGWQDPSIAFSHPDYPNLVPALAAQVAYAIGFWNEYIPKISLFFILIPAVTWLFTFARRSFSFIILLFLIPFCFYQQIWNGYMDGYLAFYFSIAMLLLGRHIISSQPVDLVSSVCCLLFLLYIKNEGALAAVIGLFLIILVPILKNKNVFYKKHLFVKWKFPIAGLISLVPFILWTIYKQCWKLSNDLVIGTTSSFLNIIRRLTDGSVSLIFQSLFPQIKGALLLLALLCILYILWKKQLVKESLPALLAAGVYLLGMIIVYLLSPNDLAWHLATSIDRTMLSVNACVFIGCYFILNTIENEVFYNHILK